MSRAKQKNRQHAIDKAGQALLREQLPLHWELREYHPDYGLDYSLEVFSEPDADEVSETLGEHIFIQLKSKAAPTARPHQVYNRFNVEKRPETLEDKIAEVETVSVQLETPELVTVERMGVGVPVLLVVADIAEAQCYFVCLNDYIDKILVPRHDDYASTASRAVHVPVRNLLGDPVIGQTAFKWYAKRPKLYAAFQRFVYQFAELGYSDSKVPKPEMAQYFARRIARYDFWDSTEMWETLGAYGQSLRHFIDTGDSGLFAWPPGPHPPGYEDYLRDHQIMGLWHGLSILPRQYEEICREWFLPTSLGVEASYPYDG